MNELIFASNNPNKVAELKAISPVSLSVISLAEAGIQKEIDEPFFTLEENAKEKCRVIHELTQKDCFAEDTGLEIEALNNEPGVLSARYSGLNATNSANMEKVLSKMFGLTNRKARFRTVIAVFCQNQYHLFEGICTGTIAEKPTGNHGFGYDPIFIPDGYTLTFAEIDKSLKNNISHRKNAFDKLFLFLNNK